MISLRIFEQEVSTFVAEGEFIFRQGEHGDTMYVIQEGELEVIVNDTVIETLGKGDLFGEMALIDEQERSASLRAKTGARLVEINVPQFENLVHKTPYFALDVMRLLAQRLRATNKKV